MSRMSYRSIGRVPRRALRMIVMLMTLVGVARAHHAPEDHIDTLDLRISGSEPSARLLTRRAEARMAIAAYKDACNDFRAALAIDSNQPLAYHGLCRALLRRGEFSKVIATASTGIDKQPREHLSASLHALRAEAYGLLGEHEQAASDWRVALDTPNPMPDWVLKHARCLTELRRPDEACDVLREALENRPNAAFEKAYARALIRSGRLQEASELVSSALERSRVKASWLVLEGELLIAKRDTAGARDRVKLALAEIDKRRLRAPDNTHLIRQRQDATDLLHAARQATTD